MAVVGSAEWMRIPQYEFGVPGDTTYNDMTYRFASWKQAPAMEEMARYEKRVPMWSVETDTKGGRSYILQSYRRMWREMQEKGPERCHYYESIVDGWPVHPYFDYESEPGDYQGDHAPSLEAALDEWCIHAPAVFADTVRESGKDAPFAWDDRLHWRNWGVLISNRRDKDSRHFIFKLPNNAMFASALDWGSFHHAVMRRSIAAHGGDVNSNPLIYVNAKGVIKGIFDSSVFTRNRQYRLYRNTKMKNPTKGHLLPQGHTMETPPDYHAFLENLVCYQPLTRAGKPIEITTISVPFCDNPTLVRCLKSGSDAAPRLAVVPSTRSNTTSIFARIDTASRDAIFDESDAEDDADADNADKVSSAADEEANSASGREGERGLAPLVDEIMKETSSALERETRYPCSVTRVGDPDGRGFGEEGGLIGTTKRLCPYACAEHKHAGNSLIYQVRLRYPQPRITIWCHDEACKTDLRARAAVRQNHELDMAAHPELAAALRRYILSRTIKPKMLRGVRAPQARRKANDKK